jgi:hypothetical protein
MFVAIAACGSSTAAGSSRASSQVVTASGSDASLPCGPASARTLAVDSLARVYESGGSVYACVRGASTARRLGSAQSCIRSQRAGPVALAGETVAYGLESCGVDTGFGSVVVRRLSDGQQLRSLAATTQPLLPESYQQVSSLVVKSDGAVAWIGVAKSIIRHGENVEVHKADKRGAAELDSGTAVGQSSLRLRGSQVTWRHAGAVRSATLN